VIDTSAIEAAEGYCSQLDVTLFRDGSLQVADDGRGLPLGIDPRTNMPGVEGLLTTLHCGQLGPVAGLSIVNALCKRLDCWVRCSGAEHFISFRDSELHTTLTMTGGMDRLETGTTVRFWPDPIFFEAGTFAVPELRHRLRAIAALCPGLRVTFGNEATGDRQAWRFTEGLSGYLIERLGPAAERLPAEPITGGCHADGAVVDYSLSWTPAGQSMLTESYVDLEPRPNGGAHVDGLRAGVACAIRRHCRASGLLRDCKLAPADVWEQSSFVLSVRTLNSWPDSRARTARWRHLSHAPLIAGVVRDSVSRWLSLHPEGAERIVRSLVSGRRAAAQSRRRRAMQGNP